MATFSDLEGSTQSFDPIHVQASVGADGACSDPNCVVCKNSAEERRKKHMLEGSATCIRCETSIKVNQDDLYSYCATCEKLLKQESSSLQKRVFTLEKEAEVLKEKVRTLEHALGKSSSRVTAVEKAYSDEAQERLKFRVERDEARNSIMCWKALVEHMKAKASCPACQIGVACAASKLLEDQAKNMTPEWKCDPCQEKEAEIASMKKSIDLYVGFSRHDQGCGPCSSGQWCPVGRDLRSIAHRSLLESVQASRGNALLKKLAGALTDFASFGDGAAVVLIENLYHFIKIDGKRIRMGDVETLGVGPSPREAFDNARARMSQENVHAREAS